MKKTLGKTLPLLLAGTLELMPLVRSALPAVTESLIPPGGAIIFRWAVGAIALLGYDAISSASSLAISPPNATVGQPYIGTVTYAGGHAGSVRSMSFTGACLGSAVPFLPGLTIAYNGGNTATVTGTPTAATNYAFSITAYSASSCGGGDHDTRSTVLVVGASGGGGAAPVFTAPPQSTTAQVGAGALLSAGASGNPVPQYYWSQGLTPIPGATNSALEFRLVELTNAGLYTVVASNASGTVSATCFLTVCITPGSNQLALDYTNYMPIGQGVTMYSYFTNAPAASNVYKWQYNFVDITPFKTNGNDLSLTPAQVTASKSGIYAVVFDSVVGQTTVVNQQQYYSYWAFGSPPAISSQPESTNAAAGAEVMFAVSATVASTPYGTTQPLHFDWYFNGTNLVASHDGVGTSQNSTLTLSAVSAANAGAYTVVITNYWGAVTSSPAVLAIASSGTPPTITAQPLPQSILVGQNASFTVLATGTPPLAYQWRKDGAQLTNGGEFSGATSNVLTLTGVLASDAGSYSVVISNQAGVIQSSNALLTVLVPPTISAQPQSLTVTNGQTANFTVGASGVPAPGYQWRFNGSDLAGATASTLSITNAQPANAGDYTVEVTNTVGSVSSLPAHLTVVTPTIVPLVLADVQWTNGAPAFDVTGPAQTNYVIWSSPDLIAWRPLQTNFTANGRLHFTDTNSPPSAAFYRAALSP